MIAIHNSSFEFHPRWVNYCKDNNISYRLVDCFANDIIQQLIGCDALMWHHSHNDPKAIVAAKPILFALEQAGMKVFPDFNTNWHFDDKLGQKYLLEALDLPLVTSYVFLEKQEALQWINTTSFPKVFKLRGGAGSDNVKLVRTKKDAQKLIRKAFGKGFSNYDALGNLKERWRQWRLRKTSFIDLIKGVIRFVYPPPFAKALGREVGYIYFQKFIPDNSFDIRVVVIGDKAFALKRLVRKNDFRASGGGSIIYNKTEIDERCVQIAFNANDKIKSQSIAYDFVFDQNNNPLIIEISYGYSAEAYDLCEGYWSNDMQWHAGTHFDFCGWMVEEVIKEI